MQLLCTVCVIQQILQPENLVIFKQNFTILIEHRNYFPSFFDFHATWRIYIVGRKINFHVQTFVTLLNIKKLREYLTL